MSVLLSFIKFIYTSLRCRNMSPLCSTCISFTWLLEQTNPPYLSCGFQEGLARCLFIQKHGPMCSCFFIKVFVSIRTPQVNACFPVSTLDSHVASLLLRRDTSPPKINTVLILTGPCRIIPKYLESNDFPKDLRSVLENVPHALENNVYSSVRGFMTLDMSHRASVLIMFRFGVFLLIIWLFHQLSREVT